MQCGNAAKAAMPRGCGNAATMLLKIQGGNAARNVGTCTAAMPLKFHVTVFHVFLRVAVHSSEAQDTETDHAVDGNDVTEPTTTT